jgi:small-conductance mechanosensitive channel
MNILINDILHQLQSYYGDFISIIPKLVLAIMVFSILFIIANRSRNLVNRNLSQRMDDPLLAKFLGQVVKISIVLLSLMFVLKIIGLGDIAAGMITGASVSAIILGFAFKDIAENFLAGIMLAFNRPFKVGDVVKLDGITGSVVSLDMRTTQIKSFDGKDIYIPNAAVVKNPVTNFTIDGFLRKEFIIGIDHGSDINRAIDILEETMNDLDGILKDEKPPMAFVDTLTKNTINIKVMFWINTFDKNISWLKVQTAAIEKSLTALDKAGYYIPRDIIELKNYKNSNLKTHLNKEEKYARR